jgi:nitrogen fixation protein FixH
MSSTEMHEKAIRPLTGRKVLAMLVAFFGVVFIVNFIMLRLATSTFGGVETDSAYRAGLAFNGQLAAARAQEERGWTVDAALNRSAEGVIVRIDVKDKAGLGVTGLDGNVVLARPVDRREDRGAALFRDPDGRYQAVLKDLDPGAWDLVIRFERSGERLFLSKSRVVLN